MGFRTPLHARIAMMRRLGVFSHAGGQPAPLMSRAEPIFESCLILLSGDDPLTQRIHECVLELPTERGPGRSIWPSEAARMLALRIDYASQDLMRPVCSVAAMLTDAGVLEATQHEALLDIRDVRGPIRLRLRSLHASVPRKPAERLLRTGTPIRFRPRWRYTSRLSFLIADAALPRR